MTVEFQTVRSAFIDQSHVVERILSEIVNLDSDTRLDGWDCGVLAYHMAALSLNLPRLVGNVDDDWPATDLAGWATGATGVADEIDRMSIAIAAKLSHDEIRTKFFENAAAGRAFLESASADIKVGFPAWQVWLSFSEFLLSRVIELTVHGLDLADAIGFAHAPAPPAVKVTAHFLDTLLPGTRPADLADHVAWIEAATGRTTHDDERLPLFG